MTRQQLVLPPGIIPTMLHLGAGTGPCVDWFEEETPGGELVEEGAFAVCQRPWERTKRVSGRIVVVDDLPNQIPAKRSYLEIHNGCNPGVAIVWLGGGELVNDPKPGEYITGALQTAFSPELRLWVPIVDVKVEEFAIPPERLAILVESAVIHMLAGETHARMVPAAAAAKQGLAKLEEQLQQGGKSDK